MQENILRVVSNKFYWLLVDEYWLDITGCWEGNTQEFNVEDNIIQICWFVLNKILYSYKLSESRSYCCRWYSITCSLSPYPSTRQLFLEADIQYSNLGILTVICSHCHTFYFECEKLTFSRVNHPKFGIDCLQEQIQLPSFQSLTGILYNYLTGDDYCLREFCNNI